MSDLSSLFPDLPPEVLRDFDSSANAFSNSAPLQVGGEVAQVTDDQIADYLRSVGSLRAPLNPAVSGQQAPPVPQYTSGQGRIAPSPDSAYVEAPDLGGQEPVAPPVQPPQATQTTPLPVTSPLAPGPSESLPQFPSSPPTVPDEPPPPPPAATRAEGIEALIQLWDGDPELRNLVAGYLTTGRGVPPSSPTVAPTQPVPPPPVVPGGPPIAQQPQYYAPPQPQYAPQPAYDQPDFSDPTLRALYEQNAALQERLNRVESAQQYSADQYQQAQMNHYEQIVESTVSKFATDYQLPPNVIKSVRETAARIGAANTYMNGTHPITGLPVRPDPHQAVQTALSIAYYATPAAQELERNRVIQRATQDVTRRQRLSGVGGSSASVPRQPPQPTNAQERRTAMNDEVREMFNGTWTGANSN